MEFWLTYNNLEDRLRLPKPPSKFFIQTGNVNKTINVENVGELSLIGKGKLTAVILSSYFPQDYLNEVDNTVFQGGKQYNFKTSTSNTPNTPNTPNTSNTTYEYTPYKYVDMIEKWRILGKPIRLIVINLKKDSACDINADTVYREISDRRIINLGARIENFTYGVKGGSGDVYFTLELKEYKFVRGDISSSTNVDIHSTFSPPRPTPKEYIVQFDNEELWKIAKRFYGDSTKCKELAMKNNINYPYKLKPYQRLVL